MVPKMHTVVEVSTVCKSSVSVGMGREDINNMTKFSTIWRPLLNFLQDKERNQLLTLGFEN